MLSTDVVVAALLSKILRRGEHLVHGLREAWLDNRAAGRGRECVDLSAHLSGEHRDVCSDGIEQRGGNALALLKK